ncbi:cache domain-containing protein [Sedimenticola sp.]|uniref:cache domain-containing protein n=1 Tax=Sedimenticola sp. TaxID=1940285 RepID=UPI003D0E1CE1
MSLKTKILLLAILPLLLVASLITLINVNQAQILAEDEIHTFKENLLASKKRELKNYISLALTSIDHIIRDKSLDEQTAREGVKQILNELTYGEDGYFFVYDRNGVNLVHPILNEIVGRNLYDLQDSKGDYVIRNLLRVAAEGGGFHRYLWNKPSSGKEEEKLSYAVQVPGWNWMLGTGLYIDDVASEVAKIRAQVNKNIRSTFFTMLVVIVGSVIMIALIGIAINLHESRLADIRLRELAHKSVRFQVSERRRFARELHDGINQLMVSVKFRIESAITKLQKGHTTALDDLKSGAGVLNDAIQEVRRISHDLRPRLLDDMGLAVALESLTGNYTERTGITTDLTVELPEERLPEDIEITLYRVVQEALTNIERHAGQCMVQLRLSQRGDSVTLEIKDNGRGFDPQIDRFAEGIGLRNMRERVELLGGEFSLMAKAGEGTRLRALLRSEL